MSVRSGFIHPSLDTSWFGFIPSTGQDEGEVHWIQFGPPICRTSSFLSPSLFVFSLRESPLPSHVETLPDVSVVIEEQLRLASFLVPLLPLQLRASVDEPLLSIYLMVAIKHYQVSQRSLFVRGGRGISSRVVSRSIDPPRGKAISLDSPCRSWVAMLKRISISSLDSGPIAEPRSSLVSYKRISM
jgi:hypothetical protein